jgi:PAS domain S-box-containing protein
MLLILAVSVVMQFCAVVLALRLMQLSRNYFAWALIAAAFLLLAVRRVFVFYCLLSSAAVRPSDIFAEGLVLAAALLLVAGLSLIAPLMRRFRRGARGLSGADSAGSEVSFRELFENSTSGVMVCKAADRGQDFIVLDVNPAAERIEKMVRTHMTGRRLTEVFPGVEESGLLNVLRRVWKSGRSESLPMRYCQNERIAGWRDCFVYRRSGGEVVAICNDISAQMRMQEELEHRERKFRLLHEQTPVPCQSLDKEGKILEVNPAWMRLTGLDREQAVGRNFSEMLSRQDRRVFESCLTGLGSAGQLADIRLKLRRGGIMADILLEGLALRNSTGAVEQIYCLLREDRPDTAAGAERPGDTAAGPPVAEQNPAQRRKLELLGELTAGMAREFTAPLTAARNAFDLMRENISPVNPHYEFALIAFRELTRMADTVEQMCRFNEPVPREGETIHLNAMLDNALVLVRSSIREKRIELRDERSKTLPAVVLPPGPVMLALINPVKNSVEAMAGTGGVLTLRTGAAEQGGVFVEIEDNGPGIPHDFLPHLFDPFTSFRHTGERHNRPGLGMAIVKRVVDLMGGSVTVRSNEGEGTCVRINLPAAVRPAGENS